MARSFTVERQLRGFHAVVIDPVFQVGTVISGGDTSYLTTEDSFPLLTEAGDHLIWEVAVNDKLTTEAGERLLTEAGEFIIAE